VDRDVERVAGLLQVALREDPLGRHRPHAGADLQARRQVGLLRRVGARLAQRLVEEILEHRARALEAGRVDVGEVVGDDVDLRLLRVEAGLGNPEGTDHRKLLRGGRGQPPVPSSCVARCSFWSTVESAFICMSNWRARSIMSTIAETALTLDDSIAPDVILTLSSPSSDTFEFSGMAIGPPSPITVRPASVSSPSAETEKPPARV